MDCRVGTMERTALGEVVVAGEEEGRVTAGADNMFDSTDPGGEMVNPVYVRRWSLHNQMYME